MRKLLITWAVAMAASLPMGAHAQMVIETWTPQPWGTNSYGFRTDNVMMVMPGCVGYGGTYPVDFRDSNVIFTTNPTTGKVTLNLRVQAGTTTDTDCWTQDGSPTTHYNGAQIMAPQGWNPSGASPPSYPYGAPVYGPGYYGVDMKPSPTQGEISSFFWIEMPNYGPGEIDVEFPHPTTDNWTSTYGDVHFTVHPSGHSVDYNLGFDPSAAFHHYGFLWVPGNEITNPSQGNVGFEVDGKIVAWLTDSYLDTTTLLGGMMANAWTGNPSWGGGPPTTVANNLYLGLGYEGGATSIPTGY